MSIRGCEYYSLKNVNNKLMIGIADTFIALNAIRALSIVALLLVFSSSIFVMVTDVRAVNDFVSARQSGNTTMDFDYDYIE